MTDASAALFLALDWLSDRLPRATHLPSIRKASWLDANSASGSELHILCLTLRNAIMCSKAHHAMLFRLRLNNTGVYLKVLHAVDLRADCYLHMDRIDGLWVVLEEMCRASGARRRRFFWAANAMLEAMAASDDPGHEVAWERLWQESGDV
jgi:hypothetical protein